MATNDPMLAVQAFTADDFLLGVNHSISSNRPVTVAESLGRLAGLAIPLLVALLAARQLAKAQK